MRFEKARASFDEDEGSLSVICEGEVIVPELLSCQSEAGPPEDGGGSGCERSFAILITGRISSRNLR
jgi:hypothetical protein